MVSNMTIEWNRVTWYSKLLALIIFVGVFILGFYLGSAYNEAARIPDIFPLTIATSTKPVVKPVNPTPQQTSGNEISFKAYLTAYTYWDNTPPGSADIAYPIVHQKAGGTGTYADPITVAVGHSIVGGTDAPDYPPGTKFYMPYLRKYFIVEDTCGDGAEPQNGPCHSGFEGHPWLDLWIDGATGTSDASTMCAIAVTAVHMILKNPAPNYVVVPGSVINNGSCAAQYSDTPVSA